MRQKQYIEKNREGKETVKDRSMKNGNSQQKQHLNNDHIQLRPRAYAILLIIHVNINY